jgi:hypothetical protein
MVIQLQGSHGGGVKVLGIARVVRQASLTAFYVAMEQ